MDKNRSVISYCSRSFRYNDFGVNYLVMLMMAFLLAGCSSTPDSDTHQDTQEKPSKPATSGSRYQLANDAPPENPISIEHIEEIQAKYEPYSLGGNKDYELEGEHYKIVKAAEGFTQQGKASWYGKKFHGHLTSNGEIYDMYSMSAAHKTLPLPSYVKVTNLDNNKETIVRINDRGPFVKNRIIDLSYAAATKLGVYETGVANVKIEVLSFDRPTERHLANQHPSYSIQVVVSSFQDRVTLLAKELEETLSVDTFLAPNEENYRLMLGPFTDFHHTQEILTQVKDLGYPSAFVTKRHYNQTIEP